ncbi:Male sterility NAD-binding [Penicillium samsonianum]|uniref:Male sterility NAD-binding n=1 Tax=Penicillium samsonianum TaxID=1882272 RepID=UPI002548BC0F|nr:Male sterility NAD-binding [Penicillium samsonianum]KAJ6118438.1 Male sterility NAD-binding [Penicillium samsonianum]
MTRFASEEALDCMLAYYKVALKRFVDDIATEVIEVKLLGAIPTLFTPITAFEMPKDLIRQVAGESEESQSRREQLNKKLWILRKGSDTCKRFVGIRGLACSCSLVDAIDSEPVDRQSRSSSPDLLEQPDKDEHAQEHTTEPEQLLDAPIPTKGSKKKKREGLPTNFYLPSNTLLSLLRNKKYSIEDGNLAIGWISYSIQKIHSVAGNLFERWCV